MGRVCLLLLALIPAAVSCSNGQSAAPPAADRTATVKAVSVAPQPLTVTITAVGTIAPENRVSVAAQEEGVVTALAVREGDVVRSGDLLVALDDRELAAQLAEARARLVEAETAWKRASSLLAEGLVTQADADSARAAYDIARAGVDALTTRQSFTRAVAPVAGVVTARHVELGDTVGARAPLVELASGRVVLRVPVSELDVVRLAVGDRAVVRVDALPGVELEAHVIRIFPAADPVSRQVTVELVLDDPPAAVRPGFLARAELVVARIADALMIPDNALQQGSEVATFVWVVEDGAAHVRPVEVGQRQNGLVRVTSGLSAGDRIVTEGAAALRDGAAVEVRGEGA